MPFLLGVLLAYLFYIPCKKIEGQYHKMKNKWIKKRARGLSIFTVYIVVFIILILAFQFIIPNLGKSIADLANNIVPYYQNTINSLQNIPEDSILRQIDVQKIADSLKLLTKIGRSYFQTKNV